MIKDTMERDMINEISTLFVMIFTSGMMFVMPMLDIECDDIAIIIGFGIILSFMYSQAYYIMAENPEMSIIDCLKESSRIMKGHKMDLFVLELSFLGWVILMGITFGIAGLYVLPYYSATLTNFYLEIKN